VRRRSRISVEAMQHSGGKLHRKQSAILWASIRSFFFLVAAMARNIHGMGHHSFKHIGSQPSLRTSTNCRAILAGATTGVTGATGLANLAGSIGTFGCTASRLNIDCHLDMVTKTNVLLPSGEIHNEPGVLKEGVLFWGKRNPVLDSTSVISQQETAAVLAFQFRSIFGKMPIFQGRENIGEHPGFPFKTLWDVRVGGTPRCSKHGLKFVSGVAPRIAGYGRYYWRAFADQASGAYFTEAIVPVVTHEDPRYYTRGHGGFFRRAGYALSRVVVTPTDSGGTTFNFSEIVGNGMEAGLSNLYYPPQERGMRKTAENWGAQIEPAALNNIVKEFWPDIRHKILRQK
jgi:hypothetical protein